ncbi:RNA polymerase sigma factor [Marinilongibacter aquaticus]|uniref:RNA polymerase sigma factor n=1 Tax=Marinilongibacter aquaticus TaxID=2975157 RepID=UPI0021BDCB91|nr:RNA polymerase sigma factor [Marinilongibacter aquaticus]UBM58621.1 RNA polymerase sigma factor [Marinilongibacter aquaticus]
MKISDDDILELIKGDYSAFEAFYEATLDGLSKFAAKHATNLRSTDDIVQEAYVKVWEYRQQISPSVKAFKSYLHSIVINAIKADYKKLMAARKAEFEFCDILQSIEEPDSSESTKEMLEGKLKEAIDSFPARQREAFMEVKINRASYQEAADRLGISVSTLEKHIIKSMKFLRDNMVLPLLFVFLNI